MTTTTHLSAGARSAPPSTTSAALLTTARRSGGAGRMRAVWILAGLAALAALIRLGSMAHGLASDPLPADHVDAHYLEHLGVTLMHLVPAMAFMVLGPLQFYPGLRRRWPAWHRWSGRVFVLSGIAIATSALWMNEFFPPVGGMGKYSANVVFGVVMIAALVIAMMAILRRDVVRHRAWMVRAFAIGLGATTQRLLLLPLFLIAGELNDALIGLGVWLGWVGNLLVAEWILRRRGRAA